MATPPEPDRPVPAREQLLALADELLEQASALREHWNDLHHALRGEGAESGDTERPQRRAPQAEDQPNADPRRLMAVDMILAGRSREQVRAFLREEYGEAAASEVMVDIYGEDEAG